jgi:hypothetical protein
MLDVNVLKFAFLEMEKQSQNNESTTSKIKNIVRKNKHKHI